MLQLFINTAYWNCTVETDDTEFLLDNVIATVSDMGGLVTCMMCGAPLAKSRLVSASAAAAANCCCCCCCCFSCSSSCCCCCCSLNCCWDNAGCVGKDDCVVTATCVVVVDDDGPTRPLLLTVAASNDGVVVVVATERDDGCVTADDNVTRPFTPEVRDAFDELADWLGLSAKHTQTHTQCQYCNEYCQKPKTCFFASKLPET